MRPCADLRAAARPPAAAAGSRENIRQVLGNVYGNKESVDDELVELIFQPSNDPGALEVGGQRGAGQGAQEWE